MNGGPRKIELWQDRSMGQDESAEAAPAAPATGDVSMFGDHDYGQDTPALDGGRPWGMIAAAALLAISWLALAGVAIGMATAGQPPALPLVAQWIAMISAPLALIGILYLLMQRHSRAEARRFGRSAAALRAEAAALEASLAAASTRLDETRASLAAHIAELVARGEDATRSLVNINGAIESEGASIARHAETLRVSAAGARNDLGALLTGLPKAHEETRGLADSLRETGLVAHERAGALEAQLAALAARSREADEVAGGAAQRLGAHIARIETTSEAASDRLDAVAQQLTSAADTALARAAEGIDGARQGLDAQAESLRSMLDQGRTAMERAGAESADAMALRLAEIGARLDRLGNLIGEQDARTSAMLQRLGGELAGLDARLAQLDQDGIERAGRLSGAISGLTADSERARLALDAGSGAADGFIMRVEQLLMALNASAREIDETLPAAFNRLNDHSRQAKATMGSLSPEIDRLDDATSTALARLGEAETLLARQHDGVAGLIAAAERSLDDGRQQVTALSAAITTADGEARALTERAAPLLIEALLRVRETATQAADKARAALGAVIPEVSQRMGDHAADAMQRALMDKVQGQLDEIAATAERAVNAAQSASTRLDQKLETIRETSAAMEARISRAQEEAEAASQDSFARRVALLIEALNSTAIDIGKVLSAEVTDSAWSAYLKGERGIFARRAVRLLDSGEVREVSRHYDGDPDFRTQVNRYIHDFEAMLRMVLATRDGSVLGVTLLSSDNGKLYVALAQAIERLR